MYMPLEKASFSYSGIAFVYSRFFSIAFYHFALWSGKKKTKKVLVTDQTTFLWPHSTGKIFACFFPKPSEFQCLVLKIV